MAFVLDVAGYGTRTVPEQDDVQQRLRRLVVAALAACGLALDAWGVDHQWSGDGINAILPADIDPTVVLTVLIRSLAAALRADNARHSDRVRLRMAVGVGLAERTAAGFGGPVIMEINRLVDSAALRSALDEEPAADLAVAVSEQAHALIISPGYPVIPGGQFTRVDVKSKEFSGGAWIWLSSRQWSEPAYLPLALSDPREIGGYRVVARIGAGPPGSGQLVPGQFGPRQFGPRAAGAGVPGSRVSGPAPAGLVYAALGGDPGWAAVKVFDERLVADSEVRLRLAGAARAAAAVREPHLAPVIGSGLSAAGSPWVASPLVQGPSLAAAVTETGPVPGVTAGWMALGVASALAALHAAGLTHHAVSPHNVLLGPDGPVLTDLGTSRSALTSGPGRAADDVLMLGATAFFAATGRSPWRDRYLQDTEAAEPVDVELDGCPSWLAPVLLACLAPDPAQRLTASELQAWLDEETGARPRSWLQEPVATRVAEYQALPPARGRFRWPRRE
jgi:hypothetical protein